MKDGLHMKYSRANQAWFVMWHDQVLRVFNRKREAEEYVNELLHKENPIDTASAFAGVGIFIVGALLLRKLFS